MDFRQLTLNLYMRLFCVALVSAFASFSSAQSLDLEEDFLPPVEEDNLLLTIPEEDQTIQTQDEIKSPLFNSKFSNAYSRRLLEKATEKKRMGIMWRARIIGESAKLETQNSETSGLDLRVQSRYKLMNSLRADVYLRGKFESGHSQDFFGDLEPSSGIFVREAAVSYDPIRYVDLRFGVIDQDWMGMSMLSFRKSFPAAMANFHYGITNNIQASLTSQYSIPTSTTLSTRTTGQETTPAFIVHRLGLDYSDGRNFELGISGSLFEYKNLPSFVAFESRKYGNTLNTFNGPLNSDFAFPFKGWFTQTYAKYKIGSFTPYVEYQVIKNEEAPETYNDGQVITLGTGLDLKDHFIYAEYSNFFAEADVVPAYYNSWAIGHTNSDGFGVDVGVEFKRYNFRIRSYYYRANVLDRAPVLGALLQDQNFYFIAVETAYDTI